MLTQISDTNLFEIITMKRVKGFFLFFKTNVNFVMKNLAMTDPNNILIVELRGKISRLVEHYKAMKAEVKLLEEEKERLAGQLEETSRAYGDLEERFNNLKLTKDLVLGSSESGDTKKRINQIVREIDKCIALLNR